MWNHESSSFLHKLLVSIIVLYQTLYIKDLMRSYKGKRKIPYKGVEIST